MAYWLPTDSSSLDAGWTIRCRTEVARYYGYLVASANVSFLARLYTTGRRSKLAGNSPNKTEKELPTKLSIGYASVDDLNLDQTNPRLGRRVTKANLGQKQLLEIMKDWTLDELAESFLASGFWPHEALLVVRESIGIKKNQLVVVEGNRRLAALKCLKAAVEGNPSGKYWSELVSEGDIPNELFDEVPYIEIANRSEVSAYLGFRHVTGIKEWKPAEKAQYIAKLIEGEGLSYEEVRRKIGSKTPTVRSHYISYRLLLQMDDREDVDIDKVEQKFSVLYLSLRTAGVQNYLHIDIKASPERALHPVPKRHLQNLANYARWLFGDDRTPPLFTDSRQVDSFGRVLDSPEGVEYLERTPSPRFDMAVRKAGVGEEEVISLISGAADNIQLALTEAHVHRRSSQVQRAVKRLGTDFAALLNNFPTLKSDFVKEIEDAGHS